MPLSWNEIKDRALVFSKEWESESSEDAEAKSFWDAFFNIFGISRRRVASFEVPVKKADDKGGFIDLLWKGVLLVEHKSKGKDLDKAFTQAKDYFPGINDRDLPRYILVSDFARFRLYDLDANTAHNFDLKNLYQNIRLFGFIAGYQTHSFGAEDPVNIKAAEKLGQLHDLLNGAGYKGHELEVLLVRLLFCLFAEDTSIFERQQFTEYLQQRTSEDGSDLGMHLAELFQILNTPAESRQKNLDEQRAAFPYVNGKLFEEQLSLASLDRKMRESLLDCCALDWSRISPAIFGSLFQSIMDKNARRAIGAHYTSETNILKLIRPLFMDGMWEEFKKAKGNRKRLDELLVKLSRLNFFDPACGCGNFLVIAYRELRLLELAILRQLYPAEQAELMGDLSQLVQVNVDQFHGIEIEEWPARIAEVALWLTDHQMNMKVSETVGRYFSRLPLKKAPHIINENALVVDWRTVVEPQRLSYILGNPPFGGKKEQTSIQKSELMHIFQGVKGVGVLDYVTCWYRKATEYMADNPNIRAAFVSTNSITQGEQVGILWPGLINHGVKIHFAHRTFQWDSEARGKAAVHCVIIGFGLREVPVKTIYEYTAIKGEPHSVLANNINPYLVDASDIVLPNRKAPICAVPKIMEGSALIDDGHLLLNPNEAKSMRKQYPEVTAWLRPFYSGDDFINGGLRYCLWLEGVDPQALRLCPPVLNRISKVREFRGKSEREATKKLASMPTVFGEIRQPKKAYIFIPKTSSERRSYIPLGYMRPDAVLNNTSLFIENTTLYHFGVLSSTMHNAWVRAVCGRLKSDYRYSAGIVYNNYPWPEPTDVQRKAIEEAAKEVLDARAAYPKSTLADLYDPLSMPKELTRAHQHLDKAVDAAYGKTKFATEAERVAFLFERYQMITSPLAVDKPRGKKKRKNNIIHK